MLLVNLKQSNTCCIYIVFILRKWEGMKLRVKINNFTSRHTVQNISHNTNMQCLLKKLALR